MQDKFEMIRILHKENKTELHTILDYLLINIRK